MNCVFLQLSSKCAFWFLCGLGGFVIHIRHIPTYTLYISAHYAYMHILYLWTHTLYISTLYAHTHTYCTYTHTRYTYLHFIHINTYILNICTRALHTYIHILHIYTNIIQRSTPAAGQPRHLAVLPGSNNLLVNYLIILYSQHK